MFCICTISLVIICFTFAFSSEFQVHVSAWRCSGRGQRRTRLARRTCGGEKYREMDDGAGAVGVARERLEKRRQEAYRARAAATVKIQRWYRRLRASHRGARRVDVKDSASNQLSPEESYTETATSASTSSAVSRQESRGKVDQHSHNKFMHSH